MSDRTGNREIAVKRLTIQRQEQETNLLRFELNIMEHLDAIEKLKESIEVSRKKIEELTQQIKLNTQPEK